MLLLEFVVLLSPFERSWRVLDRLVASAAAAAAAAACLLAAV